jgi:FixJ family two-component response regulator
VDDDPELCRALTFFLKAEGWTSRSYEHPEAFVLGDNPEAPGCLILDLQMPGMTGTELQRLLKSKHNRIPIVFLSAHCDIDTAVLAVLDGAVDFIQTPVDEERFAEHASQRLAIDRDDRLMGRASDAFSLTVKMSGVILTDALNVRSSARSAHGF